MSGEYKACVHLAAALRAAEAKLKEACAERDAWCESDKQSTLRAMNAEARIKELEEVESGSLKVWSERAHTAEAQEVEWKEKYDGMCLAAAFLSDEAKGSDGRAEKAQIENVALKLNLEVEGVRVKSQAEDDNKKIIEYEAENAALKARLALAERALSAAREYADFWREETARTGRGIKFLDELDAFNAQEK